MIEIARVLQAAHAWAITHGGLRPSAVLLNKGAVKIIDFGLVKSTEREIDLHALGALGFALLMGKDVEGAAPAVDPSTPDELDRLLRELMEKRVTDATSAKRQLEELDLAPPPPMAPPVAAPAKRSPMLLLLAAVVLVSAGVGALLFLQEPEAEPVATIVPEPSELLADDELEDPEEPVVEAQQPDAGLAATPRAPVRGSGGVKQQRAVPSAQALQEQTTKLEAKLRKRSKPGDDIEQALYVLNKQRLRLTGSPSEAERKEVAKQLAGWKRSYLR